MLLLLAAKAEWSTGGAENSDGAQRKFGTLQPAESKVLSALAKQDEAPARWGRLRSSSQSLVLLTAVQQREHPHGGARS